MADKSIKGFLRLLTRKLKSFLYAKDVLSFLLFVALSAGFWFVNALDKNRDINIIIPVQFVHVPAEVAFTNELPTHISVDIRDMGMHLFSYSNKKRRPLNIDLNMKYNEKGEILINDVQLNRQLQSYLLPSTKIIHINPDSILIKYEKLAVKKLPVQLVTNIELEHQYMLSSNIDIKPSIIDVYGPKKILDSLKFIQTEFISIKNIKDTTVKTVKLKKQEFIKYSINEVLITLYVEMFTEKTVEIPVNTINFPSNLNVRTFPAVVKATCNIGISHFNNFKITDIQVLIDFNEIKQSKDGKYKLKISNNTSCINNIRISPQEVEFILE
ncbi:MAG: CdaR family protein [Paludibacter sp.]|nr:CdaR family protein [Paludibacter sp.]